MIINESYGHALSDKFNGEQLITVTQHVQPGAMLESNPLKRLEMFSVNVEVRARLHIMKTLFPITSLAKY